MTKRPLRVIWQGFIADTDPRYSSGWKILRPRPSTPSSSAKSPAAAPPKPPTTVRTVSCGCCTNGCVCWNHQDVRMGRPVTVCDYHRDPAHPHPHVTSPPPSKGVDK